MLATVRAILENECDDLEVLVVCDGESLVTRTLLGSIQDPRLRIITQAKAGSAFARNRGLREAGFGWVSFVDDDDVPRPNWLEVWRRGLTKEPVAITAAVEYWHDGVPGGGRPCRLDPGDPTMAASTLLAGAFWIQTEVARAVGGYDETLRAAQNQDFGLRICDYIARTIPGALIHPTNDVVIDLFVQEAKGRSRRYGSSRADSARIFLERFAHRLECDPKHEAALLRIIARDDRLAGRHASALKASCAAVRTEPLNLQNIRSYGIARLALLMRGR